MKSAAGALALLLTASATADTGRLPPGAVPVSYDITITPDAKTLSFTGRETIVVDVREPLRALTLNAADLSVSHADFDGADTWVRTDHDAQTLTVTPLNMARPGRHTLRLAWTGTINRSAAGFFAIDYQNADGSPARMLATQFEAPDARRFAPMWDEPAFKARFTLSAVAPAGQLAFSNMPVASVITTRGGKELYRFAETPAMSSYLLFLGMGDLERRTVMAGRTEIGVITRRGVSAQGDYALAQAKRLLAFYNIYFDQPYPLPKLDMIAGPGSSPFFEAMENWGAIFYFESGLLLDPRRTTESERQRIFVDVAHEMAHQWFGDLVTMRWWDDLWLNEGFASWMEDKTASALAPGGMVAAQSVTFAREDAMALDATAATHPIIRPVETVDQIGEAFDDITYLKGQAVIGMLEATLGPDTFRAGIRRYMARYKYGNTVTDQLWTELAAAGRPITQVAHDFTLPGGVPLVRVSGVRCVGGRTNALLAQDRFGLDEASRAPLIWHVPLAIGTLGAPPLSTTVSGATPVPVSVAGCGPLVANLGKASYTRVLYDGGGHGTLVASYPRLPLIERLGLLGDDYALAAGGYQAGRRYFDVADRVATGAHPLEWMLTVRKLSMLRKLYPGTPLDTRLAERAVARFGPELARIGLAPRLGEPGLQSLEREDLIGLLGNAGNPELIMRARAYVDALRTDPAAIPAGIRQPILAVFATNATAADWEMLLALSEAERSPVARNRLVALLGTPQDPALAARALQLLSTNRFTAPQRATLLKAVAGVHPDLAFDWAVARRAAVDAWLEESTRAGFIPQLGAGSNDPAMPDKITAWAARNLPEASRRPAMSAASAIVARRGEAERLRDAVAAWVR